MSVSTMAPANPDNNPLDKAVWPQPKKVWVVECQLCGKKSEDYAEPLLAMQQTQLLGWKVESVGLVNMQLCPLCVALRESERIEKYQRDYNSGYGRGAR